MSRGKIIVVEDDRDIREGLCELLVRDGYDVAACGSVQEAERSIAGGGADLYLLDVMLPDKLIISKRLYFKIIIKFSKTCYFLLAFSVKNCLIQLTCFTGTTDNKSLT